MTYSLLTKEQFNETNYKNSASYRGLNHRTRCFIEALVRQNPNERKFLF